MHHKTQRAINKACDALVSLAAENAGALNLETLIAAAQARLGKAIRLQPTDFSGTEIFGMWLSLPEADLILFERSASPSHQAHIVQHELGHIMLGHRTAPEELRVQEREESPEQCRIMLRQEIVQPQELEAEAFAIRMTRFLQAEARQKRSAPESPVARRITDTLSGGRRIGRF